MKIGAQIINQYIKPNDPAGSGRVLDAGSGRVLDAGSGRAQDAGSGRVLDVGSGRAQDVGSGRVLDASSGRAQDADSGRVFDASSGRAQDADSGRALDADNNHGNIPYGLPERLSGEARDVAEALLAYRVPVSNAGIEKLLSYMRVSNGLDLESATLLVSGGVEPRYADFGLLSDILTGKYDIGSELSKLAALYAQTVADDDLEAVFSNLAIITAGADALTRFWPELSLFTFDAEVSTNIDLPKAEASQEIISTNDSETSDFTLMNTQVFLDSAMGALLSALVNAGRGAADDAVRNATNGAAQSATNDAAINATNNATQNATNNAAINATNNAAINATNNATQNATNDAAQNASINQRSSPDDNAQSRAFNMFVSELSSGSPLFVEYFNAYGAAGVEKLFFATQSAIQESSVISSGVLTLLSDENIPPENYIDNYIKNHLFNHQAKSSDTIFGGPISNADNAKRLYAQILFQLGLMRATQKSTVQQTPAKAALLRQIETTEDAVRIINDLNLRHQYMQIPLYINGKKTNMELFVMRRGGRKKIDAEDATMFFSLNTNNIGRIEALIHAGKNKNLSLDMRAENEDSLTLIKNEYDELRNALIDKGYKPARITFRIIEKRVTAANAIKNVNALFPVSAGAIDRMI